MKRVTTLLAALGAVSFSMAAVTSAHAGGSKHKSHGYAKHHKVKAHHGGHMTAVYRDKTVTSYRKRLVAEPRTYTKTYTTYEKKYVTEPRQVRTKHLVWKERTITKPSFTIEKSYKTVPVTVRTKSWVTEASTVHRTHKVKVKGYRTVSYAKHAKSKCHCKGQQVRHYTKRVPHWSYKTVTRPVTVHTKRKVYGSKTVMKRVASWNKRSTSKTYTIKVPSFEYRTATVNVKRKVLVPRQVTKTYTKTHYKKVMEPVTHTVRVKTWVKTRAKVAEPLG